MNIRIVKPNIVIIADHKPDKLLKDWIKENLIEEDPENFVNTPLFSLYESPKFRLIVDSNRFQLILKSDKKEDLHLLKDAVIKYVEKFKEINYRALGINFTGIINSSESEVLPQVSVSIGEIKNIYDLFPSHKINFGAIIYAIKNPYILKLTVERKGPQTLSFDFNYHHQITNSSEIEEYIQELSGLYDFSEKLLCKIGGEVDD